jgi:hypothetical protein
VKSYHSTTVENAAMIVDPRETGRTVLSLSSIVGPLWRERHAVNAAGGGAFPELC